MNNVTFWAATELTAAGTHQAFIFAETADGSRFVEVGVELPEAATEADALTNSVHSLAEYYAELQANGCNPMANEGDWMKLC